MDTSATNSREQQAAAQQSDTDWGALTLAQRIRSIELEGFVVLPDLLSPQQLAAIRDELDRLPTKAVDYSPNQRGYSDVQWTASPATIETIAHPEILGFLQSLFGDELICTSCTFTVADPGHPGVVVHTDAQPCGSKIFGMQASSPVLARVLYYLDDLTTECSPFKVIPRSHLCLHRDANPYHRYLRHPDERMVRCKAGSAAIINQKVFHGNYPNYSDSPRRMLAIAYRPAWAGPINDIDERDPAQVQTLPTHIQPYFKSPNTRHIEFDLPNRPDGMAVDAAGLSPKRWGDSG